MKKQFSDITTVLLDIDGTLVDGISWLRITEALGADVDEHKSIFIKMRENKLTYPEAKDLLLKLWRKTDHANKYYFEETFQSWEIKNGVSSLVDYLKTKYSICLISGSVDLYVQTIATKLDIIDWYANTELVWSEQNELIDFIYESDQAKKKVEQLNQYLSRSTETKSSCLIIGDGDSDIGLFEELDNGIIIENEENSDFREIASISIKNLDEIYELL